MCSVGDYAGESGSSNYSEQFKNLEKLVSRLNEDILFKLDGSSNSSSSNNPRRYIWISCLNGLFFQCNMGM